MTRAQQSQLEVIYVYLSPYYDQSDTRGTSELHLWGETHQFSDVIDDDSSSRPSVIHGS